MTTREQLRQKIKLLRTQINEYASGSETIRRLNNVNWVRHRITSVEPKTLFQSSDSTRIDYTYMHNIHNVYDYINQFQDRPTKHQLNIDDVKTMHKLFTTHTNMEWVAGRYRHNDKIINIMIDGMRLHAPEPNLVEYTMTDILYNAINSKSNILDRAFDIHYKIVILQPFEDCNKRVARAAMNMFLVLNKMPMIFFDKPEDKSGYIGAITARANGRNKEYTEYMLHVTERSYRGILHEIKHSKVL